MPPAAAGASPSFRSFHYAPAHSPLQSPTRSVAVPSRPPSLSSLSASAGTSSPVTLLRSKRYIAVDAATQYSPIPTEAPLAATTATTNAISSATQQTDGGPDPTASEDPRSASRTPLELPPTPLGPTPMEPGIEQGVEPKRPAVPLSEAGAHPTATGATDTVVAADAAPAPNTAHRTLATPTKRRNSQGPCGGSEAVHASPEKRPKRAVDAFKMLPQKYEHCSNDDMVVLVSDMLAELIETNDAIALKSGHLTRFHSRYCGTVSSRRRVRRS